MLLQTQGDLAHHLHCRVFAVEHFAGLTTFPRGSLSDFWLRIWVREAEG